jgi:alkylhydroperoxidase/carboxymuconolactone decarboxylase family protein YurZ
MDERRRAGLAKLEEVYGDTRGLEEADTPYARATVEHLFGEVWARDGLSVRDRRLLTLGVVAALGRTDLAETQLAGALRAGDLDEGQVGEVVLHLAHYAGWPNGQALQRAATAALQEMRDVG